MTTGAAAATTTSAGARSDEAHEHEARADQARVYEARVWRDGRLWAIQVPEVGETQARHLREVEAIARDLIALLTDQAPQRIAIRWRVELPEAVTAHLARAAGLREQSAQAQAEAAGEVRTAARMLADAGLTVRDIGQALGVSHQRAHQLLTSAPIAPAASVPASPPISAPAASAARPEYRRRLDPSTAGG